MIIGLLEDQDAERAARGGDGRGVVPWYPAIMPGIMMLPMAAVWRAGASAAKIMQARMVTMARPLMLPTAFFGDFNDFTGDPGGLQRNPATKPMVAMSGPVHAGTGSEG